MHLRIVGYVDSRSQYGTESVIFSGMKTTIVDQTTFLPSDVSG
jgi:hypothetical protein